MTNIEDLLENASIEELEQIATRLHLLSDFESYCEHVLKVQTMQGKVVPFVMNKPQQILHRIIEEHIAPIRLVRIVALKARRMGFSTYLSGRYYRKTSCDENQYATQITHEPDATDFLFKMVKRFHNMAPPDFKPETVYNNMRLLEFNTKDGKGLGSAFRVATAGKDDAGSGQLIHYLHLSESSKYPASQIKDLLTSILQCVPDDHGTEVVFESTAKGLGGEFYDRFWGARYRIWVSRLDENGDAIIEESINEKSPEDDVYTSIFLPWFCHDIYRIKAPAGFCLSDDEKELKAAYGLDNDQLAWRRWTVANKCNGDTDTFSQEYPSNPHEAFLGSGRPVFRDINYLNRCMEAAEKPTTRYEWHSSNWVTSPYGRLRVWEEPAPGESYIVSGDIAEGGNKNDFCCADVINHRTGAQVAHWHGKVDSDNVIEFAEVMSALGHRYNTALLVPERNNHGLAVVTHLYHGTAGQPGYKNLYVEMVPDPPGKPRKRYGWVTSRITKPLIIDNMINLIAEQNHGIRCRETFEELMAFKMQDNGKMEADQGQNDDRVMSICIVQYVRQVVDLPSTRSKQIREKKLWTKKSAAANKKAWT